MKQKNTYEISDGIMKAIRLGQRDLFDVLLILEAVIAIGLLDIPIEEN